MVSVEDALARLLDGVTITGTEPLPLEESLGRVPAGERVVAAHDVPPFANSAMDGFALRAGDGSGARRVIGESRAGGPAPPSVQPGSAVRIMTGAPMPDGADAVVPIEEAEEGDGAVVIRAVPRAGAFVRAIGHDVRAGDAVAIPTTPITPAVIGLLAAMGRSEVEVRRRPRVAILSTGDELVAVGAALGFGQIHDANAPALAAAAVEAGGAPVLMARAGDDPGEVEDRLRRAAESDLLVVSGGVSVGAHDHVRDVIERLGSLGFWRIAVQPGKPLAFGHIGETPVIALPGNPVSALVTFELFVRPMLRRMLGLGGDGRARVRARLDEALAKDPARRAYLRVRVCADENGYRAASAGGQASSQLLPLASANGLLVVPEGIAATRPGETYEAIVTGAIE